MALAGWQAVVQDQNGRIQPGAEVTVRHADSGAIATLYSNRSGTTPMPNPFLADSEGYLRFFAVGGAYRVSAVKGIFSTEWPYVAVGTAQEEDVEDITSLIEANVPIYATTVGVAGLNIQPGINAFRVNGYYAAGDGGAALYREVTEDGTPLLTGQIQSNGGSRRWDLSEVIPNVLQLGCRPDYDPDTGTGSNNAPMINGAFSRWDVIFGVPGMFMHSETIEIPARKALIGPKRIGAISNEEADSWADSEAFVLVPRGLARVHVVDKMITECELSGGVLVNPNAGDPYTLSSAGRLDTYRLWDSTNKDAVGATPATQKPFSVAVKMHRGSEFINTAIRTTQLDGSVGIDSNATNFGEQVDFGVYGLSPYFAKITGCNISWAFRVAAVAQIIDTETDGSSIVPSGDRFTIEDSYLEGHTQFMSRGYDTCRVLSATSDSVTIAWFASHRFPSSGSVNINNTNYAYTGLTYTAGSPATLTFTGMSGTGGISAGAELARTLDTQHDWGTGGTTVRNSMFRHMITPGLRPSTDSFYTDPFPYSGAGIVISGAQARGFHIESTYFHSRDDIFFWVNDGADIHFVDSYHEAKYNAAAGNGGNSARAIALSADAKAAGRGGVPFPAGEVTNIHFTAWSQTESHTQRTPVFQTSASYGRFGTVEGLYEPFVTSADDYDWAGGQVGTSRVIKAPWTRGNLHPLRFVNANNNTAASLSAGGRWVFSNNVPIDVEPGADMTIAYPRGGTKLHLVNLLNSTSAEMKISNAEGSVAFVKNSASGGTIRVDDQNILFFDGDKVDLINTNLVFTGQGSFVLPTATTAELSDAGHPVNTQNKVFGKVYLNTTTGLVMRANSGDPAGSWRDFMNGNTITPV